MKKLFKFVGFIFATFALFHFAACTIEGDTFYATTQISTADVTANAYPGANVLTWKALKDASYYSVYKTTGDGEIEELVSDLSTNTYYVDTKIEQATTYKYRVVSYPKDSIVHDASQVEVTLKTSESAIDTNIKGTWAPSGVTFQSLAEYEQGYNENDEVLSASTITETLVANTGSVVRVKFPVKPYAYYKVYLAQKGGFDLDNASAIDDVKTVYGYNFNKIATIDLQAVFTGEKEVTVKAIPLNSIYSSSTVVSSSTITVTDYDKIDSAVFGSVNAKWTNYNSYTKLASSRVYFTPSSYNNAEFGTSEYTVYRAVIGSSGVSYSSGKYVYNSVEKLGNPTKDSSVSTNGDTVYYYDDSLTIEGETDVAEVCYYVILNHDGKIKSSRTTLSVPNSDDDNWNFTKDPSTSIIDARLDDIYVDSNGILNVSIRNYDYATVSFTYGAFDTYNEASVAVENELSSSITFTYSTAYSLKGTSSETVTAGKYYAFRLVATKTGADDVVKTVIAVPTSVGSYYYLDVKYGSNNIYNYTDSYSIYVTANKSYGSTTFDSVTLSWYDYSALGYNIYRSISSYSSSYHYYTLLTSTNSSLYTDSSDTLQSTSLDDYVYYKVEKVGYYGTVEYEVNVHGLKVPEISLSGSKISWSSVNDATLYYIYKATSQSALESSSNYDYETSTTSLYYSVTSSYTSDYYYAVRAYSSSEGGFSKLSNVVKVEKADAPVVQNFSADFYNFNGSYYTYTLSWNEPSIDYSGYYYILRYQTDSEITADYVKTLFESSTSNSNSYNYSSTSSTSFQVTPSTSYAYTYYAVATRVYDSSSNYVWTVSNIELLPSSLGESLTVSESSGTYTLSWDSIESAASYSVYSIGKSTSSLSATDLIDSTTNEMIDPTETVTTTTATVTPSDSYSYHYFFVVALDSSGEQVGMTDIVRK